MLLCCQRSGRAQATLLRLGLNNSSVPSSRTVSNSAVKNIASVSLMPSVCVFGAGAVGLHLAAALDQAGLGEGSLSLVCRGATYEQIKFSGQLVVKDVPRELTIEAKNFKLVNAAEIGDDFKCPDIVLSCAKAHHLPGALPILKKLVGPNTLLATIQNGLPFHHGHLTSNPALAGKPLHAVDPSGELFGTFSRNQVIPGVVYVAAERTGPAEVTVRSLQKNTRYLFGTVDCMHGPNSCRAAALDAVIEALSGAGTNAWIEKDILSAIWRKLLISACVNPTNALTHGYTNKLVNSKRSSALLQGMAAEVMRVGVAVGATFQDTPEEWLQAIAARFVRTKFSMLQDVEAGRELEVAALVTSVSDIAADLGEDTPRLDAVAALIDHYNENIVAGDV